MEGGTEELREGGSWVSWVTSQYNILLCVYFST